MANESTTWVADPFHTQIGFSVTHLGLSRVEGMFRAFSIRAELPLNEDWAEAKITAEVQINSLDTENAKRDAHLRSRDFFDAHAFPTLALTATGVSFDGENATVVATMRIRDVSLPVTFTGAYGGKTVGMYGETRHGFTFHAEIDRFAFGLKWNQLTELGGVMVGREVALTLHLELITEAFLAQMMAG